MLAEHVARTPGHAALALVTDAGIDWPAMLARLDEVQIGLEVLHADDLAANVDDLLRWELAATGAAVERRAAWRRMVELDPETRALRAVLPLMDRLLRETEVPQDPRLQDVARLARAEAAFWLAMVGSDAHDVSREATAPTPEPASQGDATAVARALNQARQTLGQRRWIVARAAFAQARSRCHDVAAHAASIAERARDEAIAARYVELAARCTAVVQAIDAALAK